MKENNRFWQTKLAARLHDPAEKALVLLRDRAGHEGGTVRELKKILPLEAADEQAVKRADWWASAADRPQWPKDQWAQVHWTCDPVLIHPVSGAEINLRTASDGLGDTELPDIKQRSFAHFKALADAVDGDSRKTLLAYWRFGPELKEEADNGRLGALWEQLPADTRVPDHSIWEHLDLTSAFAGGFTADPKGEVALLALAIGPVQPFIASARSTSDLWAGSHLLSRLAWESMRPLCEALGPDAILFPRLRGVPQVDLWLQAQGLPKALFEEAPWKKGGTDANPLFAAALPNRFVAVVPASQARELAETCEQAARDWLREKGREVVRRLLETAGEDPNDENRYCFEQMRRQLDGFPEVHWAAVPFSLIAREGEKAAEAQPVLSAAMKPFFGKDNGGFLDSEAWRVLQKGIQLETGTPFFQPNPGVLYPAIFELAERVLAAAKSVRAFGQATEEGYRCSLTGEAEWLTTDPAQLSIPPGSRKDTLWIRVASKKPSWAKKGEHLSALPAIKRLWPTLFAEEVSQATGNRVDRFVVSTHTMALAHQLDQWLERGGLTSKGFADDESQHERVALPQRLVLRHRDHPALSDAGKLLARMEQAQECDDQHQAERLRHSVHATLGGKVETYYGLLLMDGDRMGKILSGEDENTPSYRQSFHPQVGHGFDKRASTNPLLARYGGTKRAISPGRHMAISGALNDFALHVVPHIVQKEYLGRLIYAGGDDVLAMLPVADLLPAAARLRDGWSGVVRYGQRNDSDSLQKQLLLENGYAWLNGRLMRLMGEHASTSAGLVVAHHQTPLSRVLREARAAEKAAKEEGGRDALHIRVIKRSGGALQLTLKWAHVALLERLVDFLRDEAVSRRAVYHTLVWLVDLPEPAGSEALLGELLAYQFKRQTSRKTALDAHDIDGLTRELANLAAQPGKGCRWLANLLSTAEFLARESRATPRDTSDNTPKSQGAAA